MGRYLILILFLGFLGGWFVLRFDPFPTFTEGWVGQPEDLIPGQGPSSAIDSTLERLLFRSLFTYGPNGQIVPDLAESYTVSGGGRTYTVVLKEAVWRDGRSVSSADVAFTFKRDPAFADVVIKQEGERQISFVLKEPLAPFLGILTRPIAPANFSNSRPELLGNSNFAISRVFQEGETVKELRLKNLGTGRIKTLRFKFYPKELDLVEAARLGEVDALSLSSFSDPSFRLYTTPTWSSYFAVFFNLESSNSLIRSRTFRKAAAFKTPVPEGEAAVNGPFSGTWAEENFNLPRFTDRAVGKFSGTLSLTVVDMGNFPVIARRIAESWERELGIQVKVREIDSAAVDDVLARRDFDAILLGQAVERDPDRYNLWHSSQKDFPGQNISGYADPRADRALEEGRKAEKVTVRQVHYANFQRLFFENQPAILVYHPNFFYWVNRKFTGIDLSPVFYPEERFWNFSDWELAFESR